MGFQIKRSIVIERFLCGLLLGVLMVGHGTDTDVFCLSSIKESLEDPHDYFSSWKFNDVNICVFVGVECWQHGENKVLNLNLTNMGLKGEFPRGLRGCSSYLNSLRLDNNMLSGHIPQELGQLQRIRNISFANNNLSGPLPLFRDGVTSAEAYANNTQLCGGPLPPCSSDDFPQSFKDGLVVGYAFSLTSSIFLYMFLCKPWHQSKHKRNNNHWNKVKEIGKYICSISGRKTPSEADPTHQFQALHLQDKAMKEISLVMERMKSTMSLTEIKDATDCFSLENAIGMGKIGIMYEGRLTDGSNLAIKRLFGSKQFKKEFLLEIRILGKYKHKNIVPLLGFCVERNERILVYQHMPNGRLSKWLHPLESEVTRLNWPQRIKIALGVARGLSWLHYTCNLHVVHRNISSECVLLDKNFEPKISNFGKAKFMNPIIEDGASTIFYVSDGKKDVYDFGSLIFELITGKTFNELSRSSYNATNLSGNPSNFYDAIEESLIGEGFENEVYTLIKVACKCVKPFPDERPTMLEVYNYMIDIWGERHRISDGSDTLNVSSSSTSVDEIVEL
ncbi:hypothetical protein JHK87_020515 [Glycine soja]|nr:hypothetical protein JHK87_020515 [Glycine soja]